MKRPITHSYWLEPGRILCGEYPRDFDDMEDVEGMTALLRSGIQVFIDLTEADELKPYSAIAQSTALAMGLNPENLEFHKFPIRDASVPTNEAIASKILRTVRLARHRHQSVYLHCWGGRGRTGTIAGCILSDLFALSGEEALILLAERWLECTKATYSECPETDEQRGFIRSFNPVGSELEKKALVAVLGGAVVDTLKSTAEGAAVGSQVSAGKRSESTELTCATMTGFLNAGKFSPGAVMEEFLLLSDKLRLSGSQEEFEISSAAEKAIARFRGGHEPTDCADEEDWYDPPVSLMRMLPVALAFGDDPDLLEKAWEMSSLTHTEGSSRLSCAFYSLVAAELIHGSNFPEAVEFAWKTLDARWSFLPRERVHFNRWHPSWIDSANDDEIEKFVGDLNSLEKILWSVEKSESYEEAIRIASQFEDLDASIQNAAGGLAGLLYSEDEIPTDWRIKAKRLESVLDLTSKFTGFCLQQRRGATRSLSLA